MARATLLILFAIGVAFAVMAIGQQGKVVISWPGYVIEMKAIFALIVFAAILPLIWFVGLVIDAPGRMGAMSARAKARKGQESLARGLIAAESGEFEDARRHAAAATELIEEPRLVALLEARAAETAGDDPAAERAYTGMLTHEDTELLGRKGLMQIALKRGDRAAACDHAAAAMKLSKAADWPFLSLFELRVQTFDWELAIDALDEGEKRKFVDAKVAARRRAVLLSAAAARCERERRNERAVDFAERALRLAPGFAPAAVMAARLLADDSKLWKAQSVLEEAWETAPHPALAHAYRDLKSDEPRAERARRMAGLVELQPEHRESKILAAELAMERGDWAAAQEALDSAFRDLPSSRICALYAALSRARGDEPNARQWLAQAAVAPREADWTDLDPDGPAFLYEDEDWARLVYVFGDAGQLIHPRLERGGRDAGAGSVLALPPGLRAITDAQATPVRSGPTVTRAAG
ncbi:MAG: heme biosynthesis protein HemY [Caulobacterales bacterium]|jgi:HemY protein